MAQTLKDKILVETIREWATIGGYSDEEILKWKVKELREKLREAQGSTGSYWRVFLGKLKSNFERRMFDVLVARGVKVSEVEVMDWPKALREPTSDAGEMELDEVADMVSVAVGLEG